MACENCPDAVTFALRKIVEDELQKLRAVIELTNFFNDAFAEVAGGIFETISAAVDAIPLPLTFGGSDLLAYVTCPLTPLALALGSITIEEILSSPSLIDRLKQISKSIVLDAKRAYETAFKNSPNQKLIQTIRRYQRDLARIDFDGPSFARAITVAATVQVVCGDDEFIQGGYQEFAELADGFNMVGDVPGILSTNMQAVVLKLQEGEAKIAALQASVN